MGCCCPCHERMRAAGILGCCWECEPEHDPLRNALAQARDLATKAHAVMAALEEHGATIVPHLLDTDDNAGQYLRSAVKQFFVSPKGTSK